MQNKTAQDRTEQNKIGQDKTLHIRTPQHRHGQGRENVLVVHYITGKGMTGQYRTKQHITLHFMTCQYEMITPLPVLMHQLNQKGVKTMKELKEMKEENVIELTNLEAITKTAYVSIEGTTDLVLNKMNARNTRLLISEDRKKIREEPNKWEDIITAIHWRDTLPVENTLTECNKELFRELLKSNAPCISAFGLKKSFGDAVVRNEIDKYKTKFDNAVNVVAERGLVPVTFTEWSLDERLMSPKKGAPVTVRLSHFSGWRATFRIDYTGRVFSLEQIVNIINLAGFGLGIGSGRTSGYGRYKVVGIE